ncbi:MAG: O-antigen ligase family protein [Chitinispirillia bacterium]|nr:O-antigen ligase family protein [Chitinispirillia bacterium]MCL2242222.1 O-antigen ligase family protein [Chitinispirillia bacterium]
MAAIPDIGHRPSAPAPNGMAAPEGRLREIAVCQILGLAALAIIIYAVAGGKYRILPYAFAIPAALLIIPKPNLIPYAFILSFFTFFTVYREGWMLRILGVDVMFLIVFFAFLSRNRIDFRAALSEQSRLIAALVLFLLWAAVGWVVNFYSHGPLENISSVFFIFNIVQLIAAVILFSQPQWKRYRDKILLFYMICIVFEIVAALGLEVLDGARSLSDFNRMSGTLGGHHGMLASVMILSFGIAAGAFFTLGGLVRKLFVLCVSIACIMTLFVAGSRGNLLGLILAMPVTVLLGYRLRSSTLALVFLSMAAAFAIFWMSPLKGVVTGAMSADTIDLSAYGRLLIWERVYEHAVSGPWLQKITGIGIGTFNSLRFNYYLEVGMFTTGAHNNFMHTFVEVGIVGLIIYLAIFAEIIRRLTARSRRGDNAARCFLAATLALLFSCLTQETFWFNPSFGRFWMMYMICYLTLFNFRGEPGRENPVACGAQHEHNHGCRVEAGSDTPARAAPGSASGSTG